MVGSGGGAAAADSVPLLLPSAGREDVDARLCRYAREDRQRDKEHYRQCEFPLPQLAAAHPSLHTLAQEHSTAFLQRVKKTEAPDYYDGRSLPYNTSRASQALMKSPAVIKRPMDLATLHKRVKSQMYRSKKAFADDLDLIWSNCLLYNSHPVRPPSTCAACAGHANCLRSRATPFGAPPSSFDKSQTSFSNSSQTQPSLRDPSSPLQSTSAGRATPRWTTGTRTETRKEKATTRTLEEGPEVRLLVGGFRESTRNCSRTSTATVRRAFPSPLVGGELTPLKIF